jgi:hypothetical protein
VVGRKDASPRWIDAIIIQGPYQLPPATCTPSQRVNLDGLDIIIVRTKKRRLGMYLLGQARYSEQLVKKHFSPRSVRTVALCAADDAELRPFADSDGIEVVVDKEMDSNKRRASRG